MAGLTIFLLGPFYVTRDKRTVSNFGYDKVRALLAYLVLEADRAHRREALAELLWPDQPAATARHSLSQALTMLRQALGDHDATPPCLLTNRETVQFNRAGDFTADAVVFAALIEACAHHPHARRETCTYCARQLEEAVALYRGELLAEFMIGDSAMFEEWVVLRREWMRGRMLEALAWLTDYYEERHEYEQAGNWAKQQLILDPWREDAYRRLMRLLVASGQRAAALREYEQCRHLLAEELGIEPDEATTTLYEQIRSGEAGQATDQADVNGVAKAASSLVAALPRHNLPAPLTRFVGRERELREIAALLEDPGCRLVTLVGPGGIGKTRLSQQVGRAEASGFAHGLCWVMLAPLRSSQQLIAVIADALGLQFSDQSDPQAQLCDYLSNKQLLLILDNFEHVLDGAASLAQMLLSASELTVLTTSREPLRLHGEWVYEVEGLRVPATEMLDTSDAYSSVQLFVQSARRADSQFVVRPPDQAAIARICQLAGGMPLAIELAAAWVTVLSCEEIASEIAHNVGFLATSLHGVPERHMSMQAVFDHSWNLLAAREQSIFGRLSIFRGGFSRQAAQQVAGASLSSLATLIAKSLLRRQPSSRYEIHELLRQCGEEKLGEHPDEEHEVRARHGEYFAAFLAGCEVQLRGSEHRTALAEIIGEMENVRSAWYWIAEYGDLQLISQSYRGFWLFFASRGNVFDAEALFKDVAGMVERRIAVGPPVQPEDELVLHKLWAAVGSWHYRLGDFERARSLLEASISVFRRLNTRWELAFALHHLAATIHLQGAYQAEQQLLQESLGLSQALGDQWLTGYSLNDLGLCLYLLGNDAAASRLCQESYAIFEVLGDRRGMSYALSNRGVVAVQLGSYAEADQMLRESLAIRRANDDRWGTASSLTQLGIVARAAGEYARAQLHFLDALRAAYEIQAQPMIVDILVEVASLLTAEGLATVARRLVLEALQHPACTPATSTKAYQLLDELATGDGLGGEPEAVRGLDAIVTELLAVSGRKAITPNRF